jgi:ATP-binding cassette subfamily F protein 3
MLLNVDITEKDMGIKPLFRGLSLHVNEGEKLAIIGRNGAGKTTLFNMLIGKDDDFKGTLSRRRGLSLIATEQEHHVDPKLTILEYIAANLPEYRDLHQVIEGFGRADQSDMKAIERYSEALHRFTELGYFEVENQVEKAMAAYQLDPSLLRSSFARLSGGQKRFVELIKVEVARADLALIDEPTNHMDYVAKASFNEWLQKATQSVVVISHDRDVLHLVDRIVEIKDQRAHSFPGNYDAYLKQNSTTTITAMNQYEVAQRSMENIKKQIQYAKSKKAGWSGTADKKNPFVVMETRLTKELKRLQTEIQKPSVWVDRESAAALHTKVAEKYEKYKDRNIKIGTKTEEQRRHWLLRVDDLSLGYDGPLFSGVSFELMHGDRLEIKGRNGAGKTTLIKAILALAAGDKLSSQSYAGHIELHRSLTLGFYEQEINAEVLSQPLGEAVRAIYAGLDKRLGESELRRLLATYLFNPQDDINTPLKKLSGGQKARYQIIKMLAGDPNLLILDEPTNHLDLPSIEELENALARYTGAVLYVSHDSYFCKNLGGEEIRLAPLSLTKT